MALPLTQFACATVAEIPHMTIIASHECSINIIDANAEDLEIPQAYNITRFIHEVATLPTSLPPLDPAALFVLLRSLWLVL
jgi:hypothetical protein